MKRLTSALALCAAIVFSPVPPASAQTYSVLWNFPYGPLGEPAGRIYLNGSLYGTGSGDGYGDGQVFKLTNGTRKLSSLVKFNNTDGANPVAGLIRDASGALFGTTANGDTYGHGNVFKLTSNGKSWTHSTLWAFGAPGDGQTPTCDLVMDKAGNIYGTTYSGGAYNDVGTVFELAFVNGAWTETILHSFGNGSDGGNPYAGLLLDKSGTLYGTTQIGGTHGSGIVFALTNSGGVWTENVLYNFTGQSDGGDPNGVLIADSSGNLYGTTLSGGGSACLDCGTVFEPSQSGGVWSEQVLYSFGGSRNDGRNPYGGLLWGGNDSTLYGTTGFGGANVCSGLGCGTVFELAKSSGVWNETIVYSFGGAPMGDGQGPVGQILRDKSGNLYGTTEGGGAKSGGIVWKITP